jgi:ribosomal-protein-alanine N-acetyltransferase
MTLPLDTPRLLVREYTLDDLDDVAEILADPKVFWWEKEPFTRERSRRWLEAEIDYVRRVGTGRYAIVLRATGRVIGGCGLVPRVVEGRPEVEVGYYLRSDEWGKGYATEAARACLEEARARGLGRIIALTHLDNVRSQAVARRLGMKPEREVVWAGLPHTLWAVSPG